jgi:hypothetical protein
VLLLTSLILSGYRSDTISKARQGNLVSIEISLGKIKPGPISLNQIKSIKKLVVKSKGKSYRAKSYELVIVPKSGASQFINWTGNKLPENGLSAMVKSQPGDMIMVANLVIYGIDKYQMVTAPQWTVSND